MALRFFDTHCHLQDGRYGAGLECVLRRARGAGVASMVCCGSHEGDWEAVLDLARQHGEIIPMVGLHPWYVDEAGPDWLARLERLASEHPVGIGECGLDFALETYDRDRQEKAFAAQLRLARALDRPLSIHCRKAWESLLALCRECGLPRAGGAVHSYSGSPETALELQRLGFHISYSCSLANPANKRAAKSLAVVREDRLLFETDAPDIPPRFAPGLETCELNEPAHIRLVAEAAARLRSVDEASLAAKVFANSTRLFRGDTA